MAKQMKPGSAMQAKSPSAASTIMNRMFKATSRIKTSGSFHGKSNTLGHGGRAAQLKAQGVPGGVIGNLARAAHAAPGQANYHGKKASIRKKAASLDNGTASVGTRVNPATVKNPSWVGAGGARQPSSVGKVTVSAPTPWVNAATGTPLKKASKKKMSKRMKASKLEEEMAFKKKGAVKKKGAECE